MKSRIVTGVLITCILYSFASCRRSSSSWGITMPPTSSSSNRVNITDISFIAPVITVTKGTTVTWMNYDNMTHIIEADDNSFASGNLNIGDSYSHTFNSSGAFTYHCKAHAGMSGSVIVK